MNVAQLIVQLVKLVAIFVLPPSHALRKNVPQENKDLWGVEDVHQANLNRLSANKNLRVEKKMAEHAEMIANNN